MNSHKTSPVIRPATPRSDIQSYCLKYLHQEKKCQMLALSHKSVKACCPCSPLHPYRAEPTANCKLAESVMSVQLCWLYQPRGRAHSDFRRGVREMQPYQLHRARGAAAGRNLLSVRRDCLLALMPPPHLRRLKQLGNGTIGTEMQQLCSIISFSEQLGILGMHFRLPVLQFGSITAIHLCTLVFLSFATAICIFLSPPQIAGKKAGE